MFPTFVGFTSEAFANVCQAQSGRHLTVHGQGTKKSCVFNKDLLDIYREPGTVKVSVEPPVDKRGSVFALSAQKTLR